MKKEFLQLAEKTFEFQRVCNECFDACLEEEDVKMMVDCIRLDRECADICSFVTTIISRQSAMPSDLLALCANICQACGKECEKHDMDHCQRCAKVCLECAELCRQAV